MQWVFYSLRIFDLLQILFALSKTNGFVATTRCHPLSRANDFSDRGPESKCRLFMGNDFFDSFKKLWGDNDDEKEGENKKGGEIAEHDDVAAGTSIIASISVSDIKPGGLRLFLMFHMMGMQNTPDRNSWRADQPSGDEYVIEMVYHDQTGAITVELFDEEIRIARCGSVPSTAYLMQESVIVQGVLDELHEIANDKSVPLADRLLIPEPSDAIEVARSSLSFC